MFNCLPAQVGAKNFKSNRSNEVCTAHPGTAIPANEFIVNFSIKI